MTSIAKRIFPGLLLAAVPSIAGAWWDPNSVTDISTTSLYGITAAMKAEDPKLEKAGLIATRRISADRAVALAAAGGFPWLNGPFALFLVDPSAGTLVRKIATVEPIDPKNAMPELKAAGPGFATIAHEDVDSGGELARRKYFFDEASTAPAVSQSYKPVSINAITSFDGSLYFTGSRGGDGLVIRLGLKDGKPAPENWEIVGDIAGRKILPIAFSKAEAGRLELYTPSETYATNGSSWTRLAGPDVRYFRPPQNDCSFPMGDMAKHQELYEKCEKERYAQGDAALVGYEGRCETENPGEYAGLPNSYAYILERHELSGRLMDISKTPLRRFFVWNSKVGYEEKPATGVYEIKSNSCKFYPMPVPDKEVLKRYRPDRARDGCGINDKLGPFQRLGDRIWFCKNFYGGEGECGVGAAGFFDTRARAFEIFYSTRTAPWSCSAILAEEKTVWTGLEHIGEGWGKTGGLAALDPATGEAKIFDVPAGITAIRRTGDSLVLGTGEGIYILDPGGKISFAGPDVDETGNYRLNLE